MIKKEETGFTLIELMMVMVLIGILAVIGLHQFKIFRYKSHRTEALTNLDGIRVHELTFMAEEGYFLTSSWCPDTTPGPTPHKWTSGTNFDKLGFSPQGDPYYVYGVGGYPDDGVDDPYWIDNPIDSIAVAHDGKHNIAMEARGDINGNGIENKLILTEEPPGKVLNLNPTEF